jgi:hypothetical protein
MSPPRARMIEDMTLAGLAAGTQKSTSRRCAGWPRINTRECPAWHPRP